MINKMLAFYLFWQEGKTKEHFSASIDAGFETFIINTVSWLKFGIEIIGAIIIFVGIACAIYELVKMLFSKESGDFTRVRLLLARYLVLALEFQLAADILSTAIAPTWNQIGKLGAIAVIRTVLNYFLTREMKEERRLINAENTVMEDEKDESKT